MQLSAMNMAKGKYSGVTPINAGGTGATTAAEAANNLGLAYKVNDSLSRAVLAVYGWVSNSANSLHLFAPLGKNLGYVSGFNVTALLLRLRTPSGGYVQSSNFDPIADANTTISAALVNERGVLRISLVKTDGWGIANNSITNGEITISGKFT